MSLSLRLHVKGGRISIDDKSSLVVKATVHGVTKSTSKISSHQSKWDQQLVFNVHQAIGDLWVELYLSSLLRQRLIGHTLIPLYLVRHSNKSSDEDAYRIDVEVDGEVVGLDIIDTAGQEIFQAVRERYIKDGEGFLLVYSITEKSTFLTVKTIHGRIDKIKDTGGLPVPVILVGNKCDLDHNCEVNKGDGDLLAKEWQCPFFETSAKERINIDEAFHELVRRMKRYQSAVAQDKGKKENKKKCIMM